MHKKSQDLLSFLRKTYDQFLFFYSCLEGFLTKNETNEEIKVKKKIVIFNFSIMFFYFLFLPLISSHDSSRAVTFHLVFVIVSFIILRTQKFSVFVGYFFLTYSLGLYYAATKPSNYLKVIGLAFIQHNQSFLMYDRKLIKIVFIVASYLIVSQTQTHLSTLLQQNEFEKIIANIKGLQYIWCPLYLYNQLCAFQFTKIYLKIVEKRNKAYKDLEKSNNDLSIMNERLKSALALLEEKNKELNEALHNRELFIASVSHEFRNPLNSMIGNLELLCLDIKDSKWREMLSTCKICCDVLLGMINNVLDVAKINAEKLELHTQPTNIYKVIEKIWSVSSVKIKEKGLSGTLYFPKNFPQCIEMDSHRLNQILLNLIGNATKFTKSGFVKVIISWHQNKDMKELRKPSQEYFNHISKHIINSIKTQTDVKFSQETKMTKSESFNSTFIEFIGSQTSEPKQNISQRILSAKTLSGLKSFINYVSLNENETNLSLKIPSQSKDTGKGHGILKIEILDSGCGIPQDANNRLFQPFSQADPSITRKFGGTGLGLYITQQIIKKMGGEIHVSSNENIGSSFCVLIPTKTIAIRETDETPNEEQNPLQAINHSYRGIRRALVVDDISLNQAVLVQYLKKLNIQADIANNGIEAVQKFKEKGLGYYSFITMDIQMPVMDGLTASKEIRNYEALLGAKKKIPLLIITGNCTETERNSCLDPYGKIQATHFFRKPFMFEECKSCVEAIMGKNNVFKAEAHELASTGI